VKERNQAQMLVNGFMSTAIIYTACELNLFDLIKDRKMSLEEIAGTLNVRQDYIARIVRPLVQYKLISFQDGKYTSTIMGSFFSDDTKGSVKDYALFCGRESIHVWMKMYESIIRNRPPMEILGEDGLFDDMENDSERFSTFNKMMSSVSEQLNLQPLFKKLESESAELKIVDVGGGTGTIIKKFLNYYPRSTGTILDLKQAQEAAIKSLSDDKLSDRCVFTEADFFKPLLVSGDIFVLSRVLHDWDNEKSELILKNVASAMNNESKLVIIDEIIFSPDNPMSLKGFICDIQMWVFCDGKERSREEFTELLSKSGLRLCECINIDNGTCALICQKDSKEEYEQGEI